MPKSRNSKSHKERLNSYKENKKKEQDVFKKKMMEHYMKMQQESIANKDAHTSTEDVVGPEINIDELNEIDGSEPSVEETVTLDEPIIDIDVETTEIYDDNDNQ